jgi:hypothetical protein
MRIAAQFGVFLFLGFIVLPGLLFLLSWLWYRCCCDDYLAKMRRLSPIGFIGCPLFFLTFALFAEPRSFLPILAPTWGLVMCIASYLGLRRALAGRPTA